MEAVLALVAVAFPLMGSPGPVTLASAAAGAAWPRRAAALYVVGMTAGTLTVITMIAVGLTGLLMALPGVAPALGLIAAIYILYLAWRIAPAPPVGTIEADSEPPMMFGGYAMAVANPKAWAAFTAIFSGYPLWAEAPIAGTVLKVAFLGCLALSINLTWLLVGSSLAALLRSERASRALNFTFAALLVASVGASLLA